MAVFDIEINGLEAKIIDGDGLSVIESDEAFCRIYGSFLDGAGIEARKLAFTSKVPGHVTTGDVDDKQHVNTCACFTEFGRIEVRLVTIELADGWINLGIHDGSIISIEPLSHAAWMIMTAAFAEFCSNPVVGLLNRPNDPDSKIPTKPEGPEVPKGWKTVEPKDEDAYDEEERGRSIYDIIIAEEQTRASVMSDLAMVLRENIKDVGKQASNMKELLDGINKVTEQIKAVKP